MPSLRNIANGLLSLFRKKRVEQDLDEELNDYLQMAAEEKIKRGMTGRFLIPAFNTDCENPIEPVSISNLVSFSSLPQRCPSLQ